MEDPIISVYIPVYNGADYIRKTIDSILSSSFKSFEIICVDDQSTDDSFSIIQNIEKHDSRLRAFRKRNEKSGVHSDNFALQYVRGEFVFYSSQDDLFSPDLLGEMYARHQETGADIIIPDMIWYYDQAPNDAAPSGIFGVNGKRECLSGMEAAILSLDWTIHGFNLRRFSLLQQAGGVAECGYAGDEFTTRLMLMNANKVSFSRGTFYYRQDNPTAASKKISVNRFNQLFTIKRIRQLFLMRRCSLDAYRKAILVSIREIMSTKSTLSRWKPMLTKKQYDYAKKLVKDAHEDLRGELENARTNRTSLFPGASEKELSWLRAEICESPQLLLLGEPASGADNVSPPLLDRLDWFTMRHPLIRTALRPPYRFAVRCARAIRRSAVSSS